MCSGDPAGFLQSTSLFGYLLCLLNLHTRLHDPMLRCLPLTPHSLSVHTRFLLPLPQRNFSKELSTDLTISTSATSNLLITTALNPPTLHYSPRLPVTTLLKPMVSSSSHTTLSWSQSFSPPKMILSTSGIPQSYLMYLFTISRKHFKLNAQKTKFITSYFFIKTYFS